MLILHPSNSKHQLTWSNCNMISPHNNGLFLFPTELNCTLISQKNRVLNSVQIGRKFELTKFSKFNIRTWMSIQFWTSKYYFISRLDNLSFNFSKNQERICWKKVKWNRYLHRIGLWIIGFVKAGWMCHCNIGSVQHCQGRHGWRRRGCWHSLCYGTFPG